ncbi:uncharacterized protein LOC131315994 [Rhododendron vialii]|uniref:uncharacterized protein LOC131315994 n=1 Tax=Rhododendron vialii TaxID=182163 RepID=UPI00265E82A5|nr:uncharacterized protein LOC131315994 [Rhododendron vialii]
MDAVRRLFNGNTNTTTLINNTDEIVEVREFRGIFTGENNFIRPITMKARQHTDIDPTRYGGGDSRGGQPSSLKISCDGSLLRCPPSGQDLLLRGEEFINSKTVTIGKSEDQNSTGVVNYEVKFQPRDAYASVRTKKHCEKGV